MILEWMVVFAALTVLVLTPVWIANAWAVFTRRFWLDEIVTHRLVTIGSTRQMLTAILAGVDTNPPVYHLLMRMVTPALGTSELAFRVVSFVSTIVALVGIYAHIRPTTSPATALASALAVWAHPLVRRYAFEARMYGPWLAAVVWCSWAVGVVWQTPGFAAGLLLVALSILACTLHTLGVCAVVLVVLGQLLGATCDRQAWAALAAVTAGPLTMVGWTPYARAQSRAFSATWIPRPTGRAAARLLRDTLGGPPVCQVLGAALLIMLTSAAWDGRSDAHVPSDVSALFRLSALALLPLVLMAVSYVAEPVLVDRYALPAAAALAPAAAIALSRASASGIIALIAVIVVASSIDFRRSARMHVRADREQTALLSLVRGRVPPAPVICESPHELYSLCHYAPDLAPQCFALCAEPGHLGSMDETRRAGVDMTRLLADHCAPPTLVPWALARTWPRLYIVPSAVTRLDDFSAPMSRYPDFHSHRIHELLVELTAVSRGTGSTNAPSVLDEVLPEPLSGDRAARPAEPAVVVDSARA